MININKQIKLHNIYQYELRKKIVKIYLGTTSLLGYELTLVRVDELTLVRVDELTWVRVDLGTR